MEKAKTQAPKVSLWKKVVATVAAALTVGGAATGAAIAQHAKEAGQEGATITQEARNSVREMKSELGRVPTVVEPINAPSVGQWGSRGQETPAAQKPTVVDPINAPNVGAWGGRG